MERKDGLHARHGTQKPIHADLTCSGELHDNCFQHALLNTLWFLQMYSDVSSVLLDIAERERERKQGERCGRETKLVKQARAVVVHGCSLQMTIVMSRGAAGMAEERKAYHLTSHVLCHIP
uniref:Uncharacterized protein n=1 Tax=Brugia malayi TaxID=6279 RepID=A8Q2F0_BRUMA